MVVPAALSSSSVSLGKTKVLMSEGVGVPPLLLGVMPPGSRKRERASQTPQESQLTNIRTFKNFLSKFLLRTHTYTQTFPSLVPVLFVFQTLR